MIGSPRLCPPADPVIIWQTYMGWPEVFFPASGSSVYTEAITVRLPIKTPSIPIAGMVLPEEW